MPKINIYLPDDLAAAVRSAGVPVSPVCQQALARAVRTVNSARRGIAAIRDPGFDPASYPELIKRLPGRMTPRLVEAFGLARRAGHNPASSGHLLLGILEQGDNLGIMLLQAAEIDSEELTAALRQGDLTEPGIGQQPGAGPASAQPGDAAGLQPGGEGQDAEPGTSAAAREAVVGGGLSRPAWLAIAAALESVIELGHNYIGCEHVVLGLAAETDGAAGRVLRGLGAEPAALRKSLGSIMGGYAQGRQATQQAGTEALAEIMHRLEALEARVASPGGVSG